MKKGSAWWHLHKNVAGNSQQRNLNTQGPVIGRYTIWYATFGEHSLRLIRWIHYFWIRVGILISKLYIYIYIYIYMNKLYMYIPVLYPKKTNDHEGLFEVTFSFQCWFPLRAAGETLGFLGSCDTPLPKPPGRMGQMTFWLWEQENLTLSGPNWAKNVQIFHRTPLLECFLPFFLLLLLLLCQHSTWVWNISYWYFLASRNASRKQETYSIIARFS